LTDSNNIIGTDFSESKFASFPLTIFAAKNSPVLIFSTINQY